MLQWSQKSLQKKPVFKRDSAFPAAQYLREWLARDSIVETIDELMKATNRTIPLYSSVAGQWLRIVSVPHGILRAQFIRVGINEGERIRCLERLPGGTVIIQKNRQQIAIGHQLARQIVVVVLRDGERP